MLVHTGRQTYDPDHVFSCQRELNCHTLELTYSGVMMRRVEQMRRFRPQANHTLYLMPPNTAYALRGAETGEEIWLLFVSKPEFESCLHWPCGTFGVPELHIPRTPLGRQVLQAFAESHEYAAGHLPRREMLAENAFERLLLLLGRLYDETNAAYDPRVQCVLEKIHEKYSTKLSVETLAESVNLSASRFAHLFREETGDSPMNYLESVRLEQAQSLLLRTDLQVKEIAACVGFDDPFYFSSRFSRRFGRAPTAWRNRPTTGL